MTSWPRLIESSDSLLSVTGLEVSYGSVRALRGVDLQLMRSEVCIVLGANGAGKSTLIRSVMGMVKPTSGSIELAGVGNLVGRQAHEINACGVAWSPEGRLVFPTLSVQENLVVGAFPVWKKSVIRDRMARVTALFPRLEERMSQAAGSLSGGEQQMLALARALMSEPTVLLLDEPSLGLAPLVVSLLFDRISEIKSAGVTILMAEQNARQALRIADYVYLLTNGEVIAHGGAAEMERRSDVQEAYLGG
jgi:branched-chain amino acid transport system ATP-binding protein